MRLPCGRQGPDCSSCKLDECDAGDYAFYDKKPKRDAMTFVSIRYDCYSEIEDKLVVGDNGAGDYYWPWPLDPTELKAYLSELVEEVCTEKQANILRLRFQWDKKLAVSRSFREIGTLLGIVKQTVAEQYHAGLKRLNKALREDPMWEDFRGDLEDLFKAINGEGVADGRK